MTAFIWLTTVTEDAAVVHVVSALEGRRLMEGAFQSPVAAELAAPVA